MFIATAAEAHLTTLVTTEIRLLNPVARSGEPIHGCAHCFCQLFAIRIGSDSLLVDERDPIVLVDLRSQWELPPP
jgi:hypothetical protein